MDVGCAALRISVVDGPLTRPPPAEEVPPTGRKLLAKLLDLQAAIPAAQGLSQEQIDTALEHERAGWR